MNEQIKKMVIDNERELLSNFPKYKFSIQSYIKKLELIKHDMDLYNFIQASFKLKGEQENDYNKKQFLSSRQIIEQNVDHLDNNDKSCIESLNSGTMYSYLDVCCVSDNFNPQVGMYYLDDKECVVIKTTLEDNNRPFDDRWFDKKKNVLIYCMQKEKEDNIAKFSFRNKPNYSIFNSLMSGNLIDIHVFSNGKKGEDYKYEGVFHPCGLTDGNTAFILFRDGCDNEIPYRNFDGQLFASLQKTGTIPSLDFSLKEDVDEKCIVLNTKKLKKSKRNIMQQAIINLEVSLRGDQLVVQHEKELLVKKGMEELANRVIDISLIDSSKGYDVLSFDVNESGEIEEKYIIVKTSVAKDTLSYTASSLELKQLQRNNGKCFVYRVYDIYTDEPKYFDVTRKEISYEPNFYGVEVL